LREKGFQREKKEGQGVRGSFCRSGESPDVRQKGARFPWGRGAPSYTQFENHEIRSITSSEEKEGENSTLEVKEGRKKIVNDPYF